MSALYIMIAIAYMNGAVVQTEAGDPYDDYAKCVVDAKQAAEGVREHAPSKVQFVYRCVDISQVQIAASIFGAK